MATPTVLVHIVTYNSPRCVLRCIESVKRQRGFVLGSGLTILVTDNASTNGVADLVAQQAGEGIALRRNAENLGFCGAHNQGAGELMAGSHDYLLILNPDVRLEPDALAKLVERLASCPSAGSACARLYRADDNLDPVTPLQLDSAGMYMTPSLRHFDRGSGEPDSASYAGDRMVFGGTGACLLVRRDLVAAVSLQEDGSGSALDSLYPQLASGRSGRRQLFDEAFFAYREDADLAWRAQLLGWGCVYVADAVGYHKRVVLSTNRAELPPELNRYGVRNRFLLQLNNYNLFGHVPSMLKGLLLRNLLVFAGVMLRERGSLPAIGDVLKLLPRALRTRRAVLTRARASGREISRWFRDLPYTEELEAR